MIAWAGWDHKDQALALSNYYVDIRDNEAWQPSRRLPLLAALLDLLPWIRQWHHEIDPTFGMRLSDFFDEFLTTELRALESTREDAERVRMGEWKVSKST